MKHGDFSDLAEQYAQNRPAYSPLIRDSLLSLPGPAIGDLDIADVGAGTGIWSRMLRQAQPNVVAAVEPNDQMRRQGEADPENGDILWRNGSAEKTGLETDGYDLLTMASSFHWADFEIAIAEFQRVLRPGGWFAALWNTRYLEANPVLLEIEAELKRLVPELKRVSSGHSAFTDGLLLRLFDHPKFSDALYMEGFHVEKMSKERYIGVWRSVNDVQVQAGPERFEAFMRFIDEKLSNVDHVEATYKTRLWAARTVA